MRKVFSKEIKRYRQNKNIGKRIYVSREKLFILNSKIGKTFEIKTLLKESNIVELKYFYE